MAWIYLRTNRSILSAMMMHFVGNYSVQLIEPYSERVAVVQALLLVLGGLTGCLLLSRQQHQQRTLAEAAKC